MKNHCTKLLISLLLLLLANVLEAQQGGVYKYNTSSINSTIPVNFNTFAPVVIGASNSVTVSGQSQVNITAQSIELKPGFEAIGFTGQGGLSLKTGDIPEEGVTINLLSHPEFNFMRYEKVEFGIELPQEIINKINNGTLNPFNPGDINIEGTCILNGTSNSQKLIGFYYDEMQRINTSTVSWSPGVDDWTIVPDANKFRIRFSPKWEGNYTMMLSINVNGYAFSSAYCVFSVSGTKQAGYLQTSWNKKYLQHATGEPFFGVGMNVLDPIPNWYLKEPNNNVDQLEKAIAYMDGSMQKLRNSGANLFTIAMNEWNYAIEYENLGNYKNRQGNAWEIDRMIEKCELYDLYFGLTLEIHHNFQNENNWPLPANRWAENCYNDITGVDQRKQFFTNEDSKNYFKRRLRYITARWGYTPRIAFYELFTEIDQGMMFDDYGTSSGSWLNDCKIAYDWTGVMADYLKNNLKDPHLLTVSGLHDLGTTENGDINGSTLSVSFGDLSLLDIIQKHHYGSAINDMEKRQEYIQKVFDKYHKPVLFDEVGAGFSAEKEAVGDLMFHDLLWSTAMSGGLGTGLNWWWGTIFEKGYEQNFLPLSQFCNGIDWVSNNFDAQIDKEGRFGIFSCGNSNQYEIAAYTLKAWDNKFAMGWLHNRSFTYINLYGNIPLEGWMDQEGDRCDDCCPIPVNNKDFTVEGLSARSKYRVDWYKTTGSLSYQGSEYHGTGGFGDDDIQLDIPTLDHSNHDYAYKIYYVGENKGLSYKTDSTLEENIEETPQRLDFSAPLEIRLYPNPALNSFFIELNRDTASGSLEIYDITGKKIYHQIVQNPVEEIKFDGSSGIYIVKIIIGDTISMEKLIIQ